MAGEIHRQEMYKRYCTGGFALNVTSLRMPGFSKQSIYTPAGAGIP
jgi:hypothetical protein